MNIKILYSQVVVIRNHKVIHKEVVDYEPNAIALSPDDAVVAIGCAGVRPSSFVP